MQIDRKVPQDKEWIEVLISEIRTIIPFERAQITHECRNPIPSLGMEAVEGKGDGSLSYSELGGYAALLSLYWVGVVPVNFLKAE
ncbi:hypothetical protein SAMN06265375_1011349 [Muriicola jejuensis]|nr:hypothetical protein SAMN06265375_1011349 [Muriicola jejuensis]